MKNPTNENWQRISQIIEHYRFASILDFARHIGLNRGENLYQIKRGNNGISKELADRIFDKFPEISKAWILTGEGTMLPENIVNPILSQIAGIPYYPNFPNNRPPSEPDKVLYFSKELLDNPDFAASFRTDELLPLKRFRFVPTPVGYEQSDNLRGSIFYHYQLLFDISCNPQSRKNKQNLSRKPK